ncbi:hypothetical protein I302_103495 [Kwoniella bestiolae CBS 10118]|uniref:Uncharacterized protein n=1 Tax=Kwoniella bestiolae CBS 10118 TaxID=1296100 RepID=A0A1B9G8K7_9TREE|nr:hypothetical protein I302_02197 [Kwoniella bestiolae CBS 10118]OCF27356.1 hypothetical protein I302_02197 [Kwoniella bestiolae CBS 10118]
MSRTRNARNGPTPIDPIEDDLGRGSTHSAPSSNHAHPPPPPPPPPPAHQHLQVFSQSDVSTMQAQAPSNSLSTTDDETHSVGYISGSSILRTLDDTVGTWRTIDERERNLAMGVPTTINDITYTKGAMGEGEGDTVHLAYNATTGASMIPQEMNAVIGPLSEFIPSTMNEFKEYLAWKDPETQAERWIRLPPDSQFFQPIDLAND